MSDDEGFLLQPMFVCQQAAVCSVLVKQRLGFYVRDDARSLNFNVLERNVTHDIFLD